MNSRPEVKDIQSYLLDRGWQQQPETWNGASIWFNEAGYELLVPPNDGLADADVRVAEILSTLTAAEQRIADEIVRDINTPYDDVQIYRTFPEENFVSLAAGLAVLRSVNDLISTTVRTVIDGPHASFAGALPKLAVELLQRVQLGPALPSGRNFTVRIPLTSASGPPGDGRSPLTDNSAPLGRLVGRQLRASAIAAQAAAARATEEDLTAFDTSVSAGVSANLCEALSALAGRRHAQPFEVKFRWGRGLPSDVPADAVHFTSAAGITFRAGAAHLRELGKTTRVSSTTAVTGVVESLHGQSPDARWRINVKGDLLAGGVVERGRTVRVWLDSSAAYDQAITAHRLEHQVAAHGELSAVGNHIELAVTADNFKVSERNE